MILSKGSWHYKLYGKGAEEDEPKNFCSYFWRVVFVLIGRMIIFSFALCLIIGMVVVVYMFAQTGKPIQENAHKDVWFAFGYIGWTLAGIAAVIGTIFAITTKDSLLARYWKAFIGRYCPKIEWTDEKSNSSGAESLS